MKGLTINIIASALAIKDEFFKRFAIYQVIRLFRRGNEPVLPRLNALLAVAWLGMIALTAAPFGVAAEQMEPNAVIRSQDLNLAAFKGQKVTFRPWDGQLRQPIIVTGPDLPVSISPQDGFLHEEAEVDTLGVDQPETKCKFK